MSLLVRTLGQYKAASSHSKDKGSLGARVALASRVQRHLQQSPHPQIVIKGLK